MLEDLDRRVRELWSEVFKLKDKVRELEEKVESYAKELSSKDSML